MGTKGIGGLDDGNQESGWGGEGSRVWKAG